MKRKITVLTVLLTAVASTARANPVVIGTGFTPPEFTALLAETLVVAVLLSRRKFDFLRVLYTWFPITLITYWLLMLCGVLSLAGLSAVFPRFEMSGAFLPAVVFLVLETGVVFLEAWAIRRLAPHRFYRRSDVPFQWKQAVLVSVCGNTTSLIIGFGWMFG
ncbi:MAG: hypothetical protein PHR35_15285 [Kiritimatiellae bacterium]|nr:hypothetical protein [Kiritimatiellia bacterium]